MLNEIRLPEPGPPSRVMITAGLKRNMILKNLSLKDTVFCNSEPLKHTVMLHVFNTTRK